jgi:putative transposase
VIVADGLPAQTACRVLGVSESGYYARRGRPPSQRAIRHVWLTDLIRQIHTASRGVYGARRVHAELTMGYGVAVGHNAVEMLMSRAGVAGLPGNRRRRRKIPGPPTAMDLVDRQFTRAEPDRLWVTDITEHPTREGKVYCAVVLDTFSRRVVGWSIDSSPTATLVTSALGMAISNRNPTDETVIHSDQGTQFTSWAFTRRAQESGLLPSMGSIGDCYDNAMAESFWARMQVELLNRKRWKTRVELANAIFEYLEIFHNRQRRHSSIGMHTPIEYETIHHNQPAALLSQVS